MSKINLKELPELLEDSCYGLTFKEKRDLKEKDINLKNLNTDDEEENAIVELMKIRDIKGRDIDALEYSIVLAWLMRIISNTFNPMEDEAKKK